MKSKKWTVALLGIGLMLGSALTACGNNGGNAKAGASGASSAAASPSASDSPSAAASTAAASPSAAAATRTYTDAVGRQVEIPVKPEKLVAHYFASEMVALGQPMIGTNYANAKQSLSEAQLSAIEDVGGADLVPNAEKLVALAPDLIVVPDFVEKGDLEQLAKIAPTVAIAYGTDEFARLRTLGDLVGRADAADAWIAAYEDKAAHTRDKLKGAIAEGETATAFILYGDKKLYVYGPARVGVALYDSLGFVMPESVGDLFAGGAELWKEISIEKLPDYAGDRILLVQSPGSEDTLQALKDSPVWNTLPAVKSGHAYVVPARWGLNDPLTLDWQLDEAAKLLAP
ncbi:ABC transporter substrate-binding protein [Cohnella hashimotonis]|uniref:ABC transporter substrate-binding protein n=1 Tax=Cohnella hashimotonis TaxID=2826895 RepID=A0ABT6THZ4_9BACL|nr:ABC transporter substrate-binding protein [Cohnella hashimotonis]MDI4646425.1 ABC transporter substrate-binding protein [Cohnella hashimotonis]